MAIGYRLPHLYETGAVKLSAFSLDRRQVESPGAEKRAGSKRSELYQGWTYTC